MGLDKIYFTFYRYFGGTEDLEENKYDNRLKYVPANSIFLDGNFVLYNVLSKLESDLNSLLKILLSVPHNSDRDKLIELVKNLFEGTPLKEYEDYFEDIFDLGDLDSMIMMLRKKSLDVKSSDNRVLDIICDYYVEYVNEKVLGMHNLDFLKNFYLIFDGIPSGFKIIEQRRRRLKNFLESQLRKKLLGDKLKDIEGELGEYEIDEKSEKLIYDYGLYVKNIITLGKSFGPSSVIFEKIMKKLYVNVINYKIKFWYSGVNEPGEGDYKIVHLIRMCKSENVVIHCSDLDFLVLGSRLQTKYEGNIYMIRHNVDNYCVANFVRLNNRISEYLVKKYNCASESNLIHDFNFVISLFGNDYIPSLMELNFDNNLNDVLYVMGNKLWINKKYVVNYDKLNLENMYVLFDNLSHKIDRMSFVNMLKKGYVMNEIIKVIPSNINSYDELVNEILLPYWYKNIVEQKDWNSFYRPDIRIDIIQKYVNKSRDELEKIVYDKIRRKLLKKQIFNDIRDKKFDERIVKVLDKNLKSYCVDTYGLEKKVEYKNFSKNEYDNLYYYYYYKTRRDISNKFCRLNNSISESEIISCETYDDDVKKSIVDNYVFSLIFNNYKFYNPMKLSYEFYKYYISPKVKWLKRYVKDCEIDVEKYVKTSENYIDNQLHLLVISANSIEKNKNNFVLKNSELVNIKSDFDIEMSEEIIKINNYRNIDLEKLKKKWDDYKMEYKCNDLVILK